MWTDRLSGDWLAITDDNGHLPGAWLIDFNASTEEFQAEYERVFGFAPDMEEGQDWTDPDFLWYNVSQPMITTGGHA